MTVTNNATVIEDFEGVGPTYTSIGGGQSASNNTDIFLAGAQSGGRRTSNATTKGFYSNPGGANDVSALGVHVKFYIWVTHYTVITAAEVRIGSSTATDYETHVLTVSEYPPLGGWWPIWVEVDAGADTGTPDFVNADEFAFAMSIPAVGGNAQNQIVEQIHYSQRPVLTWDGSTGDFASLASTDFVAAVGVIVDVFGIFYLFANLQLGSSTATIFTDSRVAIISPDFSHLPSSSTWLGIDVDLQNSSTIITWTDSIFGASDPSGATRKPDLIVTGTAGTADFSRNTFTGLRIIDFTSAVTMNDGVIANTGLVDASTDGSNGADLSGTSIQNSTVAADESSLRWNVNSDPDGELDNCKFDKGTAAHHAIEFGASAPLTMTVRGLTSTGFNASDAANDSFFLFADRGSDQTWTVNIIGGSGNFSFKKVRSGDTINIVISPVTTLINVKDNINVNLQNARVLVEAGDDSGDLPFEDTVTITNVTTVASVAHTAHGMENGDKVAIRKANESPYNGVFAITNVTTNAYDYTMGSDPGGNATGTINATGVVIEGLTDASGNISASASYSVDQVVRGVARKSTATPFFKLFDFTDTIDNGSGLTKSLALIIDE